MAKRALKNGIEKSEHFQDKGLPLGGVFDCLTQFSQAGRKKKNCSLRLLYKASLANAVFKGHIELVLALCFSSLCGSPRSHPCGRISLGSLACWIWEHQEAPLAMERQERKGHSSFALRHTPGLGLPSLAAGPVPSIHSCF